MSVEGLIKITNNENMHHLKKILGLFLKLFTPQLKDKKIIIYYSRNPQCFLFFGQCKEANFLLYFLINCVDKELYRITWFHKAEFILSGCPSGHCYLIELNENPNNIESLLGFINETMSSTKNRMNHILMYASISDVEAVDKDNNVIDTIKDVKDVRPKGTLVKYNSKGNPEDDMPLLVESSLMMVNCQDNRREQYTVNGFVL